MSYRVLAILGLIVSGSAYATTGPETNRTAFVLATLMQTQTEPAGIATAPPQTQPAITPKKPRPGISRSARRAPAATASTGNQSSVKAAARANAPVVTVTGPGPGQAGYVHYFVIKAPEGDEETQVGIELPDQRIAWSFPELGVVVSPFIAAGTVQANGKPYEVQYLYGLRPFPDDESMRALQAELPRRVVPWVEDATPYCNPQGRPDSFCVSCLGFALRILFPGPTLAYPALPRDFRRAAPNTYYTTEDLLLYLVGLHGLRGKEARLKRVEELTLADNLREEVVRLVNATDPNDSVAAADAIAPPAPAAKSRAGGRPSAKNGQQRAPQRRGS